MAVRTPLYYDSGLGNPRIMNAAQINAIKLRMKYLYYSDPSVSLTVYNDDGSSVPSGASIGSMIDTRFQAGESISDTRQPTIDETPNITTVSSTYSRIYESVATEVQPEDTNRIQFPVYHDTNEAGTIIIRSMTLQDMYDTFAYDVINGWTDHTSTAVPGLSDDGEVYTVWTSATPPTNYSLVSNTPIFIDTISNTSAYSAPGIPESLDQSTTVGNYYLHKKSKTESYSVLPLKITAQGNLIELSTAEWDTTFGSIIKYLAQSETGYKLRYAINGTGTSCGSAIIDTKLDGAGEYNFLESPPYWIAQKFPSGSSITISTYNLTVQQI